MKVNIPVAGKAIINVVHGRKFPGNESRGISKEMFPLITDRISIPGPSVKLPGIDSLNVGMAASIIFYEFTRNKAE